MVLMMDDSSMTNGLTLLPSLAGGSLAPSSNAFGIVCVVQKGFAAVGYLFGADIAYRDNKNRTDDARQK